ncbi:MAG: hypothetical protein KKC20_05965 [Proteobacteria bacterium]|nr:hypothetical protein [Pseudomonadota bacterium]
MMRFKGGRVPFLCLGIAVALLFGRGFIPHGEPSSVPLALEKPADGVITIHYHERPPYYMTGPLGVYGLCADPVKRAFHQANIPFRWEKTPAKRQLDILRENRSRACLIGWFKNSEREKFARYSHPIYQDKPFIALARADNPQLISNGPIEEILLNPDLVLLRKNTYSYGKLLDTMILKLGPRQRRTSAENIGMLKIIHSGGADYFFISEEEATQLPVTSGLLKTDFKTIRFFNMPGGNKRYLLFSKQVENQVIDQINWAIKDYENDGFEKINCEE